MPPSYQKASDRVPRTTKRASEGTSRVVTRFAAHQRVKLPVTSFIGDQPPRLSAMAPPHEIRHIHGLTLVQFIVGWLLSGIGH